MKKILLLGVFFALWALPAHGQTQTVVTGCINDPNGIPYAGGTVTGTLVPVGGPAPTVNNGPIQGSFGPTPLDGNGCFVQGLWPNAAISPAGTKWQFTINNPGAQPPVGFGPVTFTPAPITIVGSTQNISATLTAAAVKLWNDGGAAGSTAFSAITTGVNSGQILTVGNGSTLTFSGSGVINANECNGVPCGTGAGFGFASGAVVAGSTGNTPANGFTLNDGAGDTIVADPSDPSFTITDAAHHAIISSTGLAVFDVGGDEGIYGDTSYSVQLASGTSVITDGNVPSTIWNDGAGDTEVIQAAASGSASLIGAVFTINGPAGLQILCDGTVPSCTWDAGLGSTTTIGAGTVTAVINTAGGVAGIFASTDTVGAGADAVIASVAEIDNAGATQESDAVSGTAGIAGSNANGDTAFAGVFTATDSSTGGTVTEIAGLKTSAVSANATTALVTALHVGVASGGALAIAELIDKQGAGIPYQRWANTTSGTMSLFPPATGTEVITFPAASGTISLGVVKACGTTTACANTVLPLPIIVFGTVALTSGAPSTATLTGLPFTSITSYTCTATEASTAAGNLLSVANASASSTVITGPTAVTDTINYVCTGS